MSDNEPCVWQAKPHTKIKHEILSGYLDAWAAIMSNQSANIGSQRIIRFIDAFAGPGVFLLNGKEQPGSPIRSIRSIANHGSLRRQIHTHFIEFREDRYKRLIEELEKAKPVDGWPRHVVVHPPEHGDCHAVIDNMLGNYDSAKSPFGPALVFLDQFGYGSVPMNLINKILSHPQCEVLTFLDAAHLNRFLHDPPKDSARTRAFGGDEWRTALDEPEGQRANRLRKIYRDNMKTYGGANWVWDFAMLNDSRLPICWLFFGTKSDHGLEEMKLAMRRVNSDFAYADADSPDQFKLFSNCDDEWLRNRLADEFAGQVVTVSSIRCFVLEKTPLVKFARVLRNLRAEGIIKDIGTPKIAYTSKDQLGRKVVFEQRGFAFGI